MAKAIPYSGDEYSDDDEDGEELDPRVHDELERLNMAANSINHLEAELDEARAVFRQTMAAATYHLNDQIKKVGLKNIKKARPFYDVLRAMRKAHCELQKATLQYEKANSRHVCARQRVHDAEHRVFSSQEKRTFDTALQELLNQATIEVNEAENQKKESWLSHQKMYKSYQDVEKKAKEMQRKLKKSIEKARPYFVQKVGFDRHLWQLKQRVDSIHKGIGEAKLIYSKCLKSLEIISDDIHQKRKDKKTVTMIANLQEREAGVGADSGDDMSLDQSQLDLDLDCDSSLVDVDGVLPDNLPEPPTASGEKDVHSLLSGEEAVGTVVTEMANMSLESADMDTLDRRISGAESPDSQGSFTSGVLKREVYGCEQEDVHSGEGSSDGVQRKEQEQDNGGTGLKTDHMSMRRSEDSESVHDNGDIAGKSVRSLEDTLYPNHSKVCTECGEQHEDVGEVDSGRGSHRLDVFVEENQTVGSDIFAGTENSPLNHENATGSDTESHVCEIAGGTVVLEKVGKQISQEDNKSSDQNELQNISETTEDASIENGEWI